MTPPPTLQELIELVRQDASSEQPLDQLVAAAATVAQLEETSDALLGHFVDRCRRDGQSWSQISAALGVTKQAVHKRFASAIAAHMVAGSPTWTLERFTDRARHVVAAAQQAALDLGENEVGTEHLLLGLFSEPAGIAGRVLAALNVTEASMRAAVPVPAPAASAAPTEQASKSTQVFSDDTKRALGDALAVALEMGHNYIGTEHILLGLYRNDDSTAVRILANAGAMEAAAGAHVAEILRDLQQTFKQ
ncbi:MAG: Clp protease N-terminal domain-containing protein [Streptosporangiaceae bacterium]